MQYDAIILELMSRIKALEDEVSQLKSQISEPSAEYQQPSSAPVAAPAGSAAAATTGYTKMTTEMMDICYDYGKKCHENPSINPWDYADAVVEKCGMNRNSAIMYISAVKCMLEGTVYKRAISGVATKRYFDKIYQDFGPQGLSGALRSARAHAAYRNRCNIPSDSVLGICDEYEALV